MLVMSNREHYPVLASYAISVHLHTPNSRNRLFRILTAVKMRKKICSKNFFDLKPSGNVKSVLKSLHMQHQFTCILQTQEIAYFAYWRPSKCAKKYVPKIFLIWNPQETSKVSWKVSICNIKSNKCTKSKICTKNHDFSNVVANIWATRFFLENPAVSGNKVYAPLSSCKKSKKSIVGKYHNFWRTNY